VWDFALDDEYFRELRKTYFKVTATLWLYFDGIMEGTKGGRRHGEFVNGLSDDHLKELWAGVEATLPADISIDRAKAIVDPEDVRHGTYLVPTQYQGRDLQERLRHKLNNPSSSRGVNPNHGKCEVIYRRH
jgi:hypothetical protein